VAADGKSLEKLARRALSGKGAHVGTRNVFSGLGWQAAGSKPRGVPHSVYQLLKHMSYWQDWVVAWLEGKNPAAPRHPEAGLRKPPPPVGPSGTRPCGSFVGGSGSSSAPVAALVSRPSEAGRADSR
jgi:hypothetical protein